MNFIEKYNTIINLIENNIYDKPDDISELISKKLYTHKRQITEVFRFVTDYTFADYVGLRKLEHIYNYKNQYGCSWEAASYEYGEDYSTSYRRFKNKYGISPDEISDVDDFEFLPALTFDKLYILEQNKKFEVRNMNVFNPINITFEQYKYFDEIMNMQSLYGFDSETIVTLFNIGQKHNIPLDIVCECAKENELYLFDVFDEEELEPISEDILTKAFVFSKEENLDCASVYYMLRSNYDEEIIKFSLRGLIPEDVDQFQKSMRECGLTGKDISEDVVKLYYTKKDQWFYIGDDLSVADCKGLVEAAKDKKVDFEEDPEQLVCTVLSYENDYEGAIKSYMEAIEEDWDILSDAEEIYNNREAFERECFLDDLARRRGEFDI